MSMKPGSRWKSAVCSSEVVIVRPPKQDVTLHCGGAAMIPLGEAAPEGLALAPEHAEGTHVGKRYTDAQSGLEVLGSKAGKGSLSADGRKLALKTAKPLPASD